MMLLFNPDKLPRTMTRAEWKECDRWRRVTQQVLKKAVDQQMMDFAVYGSTMPAGSREAAVSRIINPPVLLHPSADPSRTSD